MIVSGIANRLSDESTRRLACAVSPKPPPITIPCISAVTGLE